MQQIRLRRQESTEKNISLSLFHGSQLALRYYLYVIFSYFTLYNNHIKHTQKHTFMMGSDVLEQKTFRGESIYFTPIV